MVADEVAVYIGAGLDTRPLRILGDVRRFVYADSRPKTQARLEGGGAADYSLYYNYDFVDDVIATMNAAGFYVHDSDHAVLLKYAPRPADRARARTTWRERLCLGLQRVACDQPPTGQFMVRFVSDKTKQTVYYHFNTVFPEEASGTLRCQIYAAETLVVAGFHPHKSIAKMMKPPFALVLLEGTSYGLSDDPDEQESLVAEMHREGLGPRVSQCTHYHKEYVGEYCVSMVHADEVTRRGRCMARVENAHQ